MRDQKTRTKVAFIMAAASAVLAVPTLAHAQADNTVYACVQERSKVARIVSVGTLPPADACTPNEVPVQWNITGPAGADGTDGTSVTVTGIFAGSGGGCANGGVSVLDGSSNTTYYLCNGADGAKGDKGDQGPAATRAAGPCFSDNTRYVDCGNGTVTDTDTGLIWLKQTECLGSTDWVAANGAAAALKDGSCGLTDGSAPGDWRLPTRAEWDATIARAVALGCTAASGNQPSLTNDTGTACFGDGSTSSFTGVLTTIFFWSSSSQPGVPRLAGLANLADGVTMYLPKAAGFRVWPVRGGPR